MLHPTRFHAPTQTPTPPGVYFPPPQKVASLTTKPLAVVLVHAGPLDISPMVASPRVGAILSMWHPGQHGSVALADLLLGRASPSGEKRGPRDGRVRSCAVEWDRRHVQACSGCCTCVSHRGRQVGAHLPWGRSPGTCTWLLPRAAALLVHCLQGARP